VTPVTAQPRVVCPGLSSSIDQRGHIIPPRTSIDPIADWDVERNSTGSNNPWAGPNDLWQDR